MAAEAERATAWVRQITRDDLKWLAYPVCKDSLAVKQTTGAGSHLIVCNGCKQVEPVVDGFVVLLADRAAVSELGSQP